MITEYRLDTKRRNFIKGVLSSTLLPFIPLSNFVTSKAKFTKFTLHNGVKVTMMNGYNPKKSW